MTNENNDQETDCPFKIATPTTPTYAISVEISEWLQNNLQCLKDTNNNTIFGKVNNGFNQDTIKTFGKKPVCDIYIDEITYNTDFDNQYPEQVQTILIFYMKGANNNAYNKACELHDYIMQQFITNNEWKELTGIVKETRITNSRLMTQPIQKKWGVMGAFELTHTLYRV